MRWNTWNYLIAGKKMSLGSFKNVINKICSQIIYIYCMFKEDFTLNNLKWLICHKTQLNQILYI